jgi:hypothetical protein
VLDDSDGAVFDRRALRALVDGQRRGRRNPQRIFARALFEQWRREYGVTA